MLSAEELLVRGKQLVVRLSRFWFQRLHVGRLALIPRVISVSRFGQERTYTVYRSSCDAAFLCVDACL